MGTTLWRIMAWVQEAGPVKGTERVNMMVLADAMKEKLQLKSINAKTTCSPAFERAVREAAELVVGSPCPVR